MKETAAVKQQLQRSLSLLFFIRSSLIQSLSYTLHIILSYNGYKLNSQLTCSRGGFIAQSVEHRTGIMEVMGSNPVEDLFHFFICSSLIWSLSYTLHINHFLVVHPLVSICSLFRRYICYLGELIRSISHRSDQPSFSLSVSHQRYIIQYGELYIW